MSRSERLFDLLQVLRQHRRPVSGMVLAEQTGVSIRTLYRDIASLQSMGAMVEGEPGIGYVLKPGFMLPPLMFTPDEIEAIVLGSRWVAERTDSGLGIAARSALARIASVLPSDLREDLETSTLVIGPATSTIPADIVDVAMLRQAIRAGRKLTLVYGDATRATSERTIWPFALSFFDSVRMLLGWCELRQGFRHFRTDRIVSAQMSETRYPERRQALFRKWLEAEGITKRFD